MTSRLTSRRYQQRQRYPSIASDGSISPTGSGHRNPTTKEQPRTTPRTKRRSITQLNELIRRQKEEQYEQQRQQTQRNITPEDIERKMESLLEPQDKEDDKPRERRVIQVAVRCRPRKSSRVRRRGSVDENEDNEEEDLSSEDSNASEGGRERVPHDSVVEYDIPSASRTRLPAISVPSHVLALGGHGPRRRFEFDRVFPPWMQQRDVYDAVVNEAIEEVLMAAQRNLVSDDDQGSSDSKRVAHATIVVYGQTGTGKTYTMGMLQHTDPRTHEREHGIIPRAILHILSRIHAHNRDKSHTRLVASMSFLQIYLETIQDLLVTPGRTNSLSRDRRSSTPGQTSGDLQVRLDSSTNDFYVAGLSEFPIADVSDARALLELAAHNRVLAATARNKTSSRSHTLLTIKISPKHVSSAGYESEAEDSGSDNGVDANSECTVSFVDLAGSERVEGALHFLHATRKRQELRIREAKFINRSLSALGSVIAALSAQDDRRGKAVVSLPRKPYAISKPGSPRSPARKPAPHIRFRDSQLTKLLQSRLMNGNGRLVLIATIDDRPANLTETLSTLKFASQCRRVDLSQSRSKSEAARKRREETLLKQVFAEVKAMYEEREAALQKQHQLRIEALEERIRVLQQKRNRSSPSIGISPRSNAAYMALCSLSDVAQRQQHLPVSEHPSLDSFEEEADVVNYVAELYRPLKEALQLSEHNVGGPELSEPRRKSPRRQRSVSGNEVNGVDTIPVGTMKPKPHQSTTGLNPADDGRTHHLVVDPNRATDERAASTSITQDTKRTSTVNVGAAIVTTSTANENDFQALARYMFTSGMLQSITVSSDEDGDYTFSQIEQEQLSVNEWGE